MDWGYPLLWTRKQTTCTCFQEHDNNVITRTSLESKSIGSFNHSRHSFFLFKNTHLFKTFLLPFKFITQNWVLWTLEQVGQRRVYFWHQSHLKSRQACVWLKRFETKYPSHLVASSKLQARDTPIDSGISMLAHCSEMESRLISLEEYADTHSPRLSKKFASGWTRFVQGKIEHTTQI